MHQNVRQFLEQVREKYPSFFKGGRILEVGSRDINGSVRDYFADPDEYVGLDCTPGPCVDLVTLAHEYQPSDYADVVISCEAFEHDQYLKRTIPHILSLLRPNGLFVATWAGPLRAEHGTKNSDGNTWGTAPEYYKGVSADEFIKLAGGQLDPLEVVTIDGGQDVYACGRRFRI